MKFCKDCKHALGDDLYKLRCDSPKNSVEHVSTERYLVSGIEQPVITATLGQSCMILRQYEKHPALGIELCGPGGKWFELP